MSDQDYPTDGTVKIFGVAGSGKTRELQRIAEAWVRGGLGLDQLVAVSFTRVGARTLVNRVTDGAVVDRDDLRYCRTLHSLCYRLLGLQRNEVVGDKALAGFFAAQHILYESEARGGDPDGYQPQLVGGQAGNHLLAFLSWCRNREIGTDDGMRLLRPTRELLPHWDADRLYKFSVAYREWKISAGIYDFTDMLEMALVNRLAPPEALVMLVDEVQDCTALQLQLVQAWSEQVRVTYIAGDDDQSIYSWLGAAPQDFLRFPGEAFTLPVNRRSTEAVVAYSARIIKRNRERQPKDLQSCRPGGTVTAYGTLSNLERLSLQRSSFILGRTRRVLAPLQARLEKAGVPFTVRHGSGGLPDAGKAGADYRAFRAVLALREGRQISLLQLHDLYQSIRGAAWTVRGWKKRVQEQAARESGEQAPTLIGIGDLADFGGTSTLQNAIAGEDTDMLSNVDSWKRDYWNAVVKRYGADVLYQKPSITVSTVHGVKGEEADDVYVVPDIPYVVEDAMRTPSGHEGERRVMYVAASRAKDNLHILRPTTARHLREMLTTVGG